MGIHGGGIFKSTNAGASWTLVRPAASEYDAVFGLVIDPAGKVFASTSDGLFKSSNGGASWADLINARITALVSDPATPRTLYAASPAGVFQGIENGIEWTGRSSGLNSSFVNVLAPDPHAPGTLYAGTGGTFDSPQPLLGGVFKSTDGGLSWTAADSGITWPGGVGARGRGVTALAVDPLTPGTLYTGTPAGGVFKSTDGGASWRAASTGLGGPAWVRALAIDPATPGTVYAGVDSGIYKSTDGGAHWVLLTHGGTHSVSALVVDPASPDTLYAATWGWSGGVLKSTDGGASWAAINAGLANPGQIVTLAVHPTLPGTLFAGAGIALDTGAGGGVFKSVDGGASWAAVGTRLRGVDITALAIDPATHTIHAGTRDQGIFKHRANADSFFLPDNGAPVTLALPGGGSIEATSNNQLGTQVQLVPAGSGVMLAMVTSGSALLQHGTAGQPITGLPRSSGGPTLLTPTCAATQMWVTVTGNTRTVLSDGCAVAMSNAGTEVEAIPSAGNIPKQDVRVFKQGPLDRRTLLVSANIALPITTRWIQVYVLALIPGDAANPPVVLQRLPTGGWAPLTTPAVPVLRQYPRVCPFCSSRLGSQQFQDTGPAATAQVLIEVEQDSDLTPFAGTEIYIGYGTSEEEMLQAGRYRAVYRVR